MKLSAVFSIVALAQVSLADFYFFRVEANSDHGYQISGNAEPKCDELAGNTPWYGAKSDVSKDRDVRCVGDEGCWGGNDPNKIVELEKNFGGSYHWTIYKNQSNFDMINLNDEVVGHCDVSTGFFYSCPSGSKTDNGSRKFLCKIPNVSADDIKNYHST